MNEREGGLEGEGEGRRRGGVKEREGGVNEREGGLEG